MLIEVGNQLPILLISFVAGLLRLRMSWESVTNPLDKLFQRGRAGRSQLGISYQSS